MNKLLASHAGDILVIDSDFFFIQLKSNPNYLPAETESKTLTKSDRNQKQNTKCDR